MDELERGDQALNPYELPPVPEGVTPQDADDIGDLGDDDSTGYPPVTGDEA